MGTSEAAVRSVLTPQEAFLLDWEMSFTALRLQFSDGTVRL